MPHIVWSRTALADLDRVLNFLEAADSSAVSHARKSILEDVHMLTKFPGIGRKVQGFLPNVREIFIPFGRNGYVLRYQVSEGEIVIANLRHSREVGYHHQVR